MNEELVSKLLEALKSVLPHVVTQVVACCGLKCREAVCDSCNPNAEAAAEEACKAYSVADKLVREVEGFLNGKTNQPPS